jgi:aerobic carbon-monoxide dehydrogenase medium subunit
MTPFAYHKPQDLAAVKKILAASSDAALLAGGMTLLPTLKNRLREVNDLVDLANVASLKGISVEQGTLRIGAMTSHADIAASTKVRDHCAALAILAAAIGDPQVRNRGTIGGSLANSDPAADWPAAVLACNAILHTTQGDIAAADFFTAMFETALQAGELITAVSFPKIEAAAYAKHRHIASGYAVAGVFVARGSSGVRVAVTGAVSVVERWHAVETALTEKFAPSAIENLLFESDNLMSDIHASQDYRANLVAVMLRRAVENIR